MHANTPCITHTHLGTRYVPLSTTKSEACQYAIVGFRYMLPIGQTLSWSQFCDLILAYCDHPKAKALVQELLA